jgi:hypothetical protein
MIRIAQILTLWLGLAAIVSAQVTSSEPLVYLNHFFVVVDQTTYQDIQDSEYLKGTFAVTESRETIRNDASYSGFYVYGENTYFEFLTKSLSPWESAIILSGDNEGSLESVKDNQLPQLEISSSPITREFEGRQVPWFFTAGNLDYPAYSQFDIGIMEYHPQYLFQYHPEEQPQSRGVSRKEVLARYASIMDISQSDRLFKDVIGITVTVTSSERAALLEFFKSLGFVATSEGDYDVLTGNEFELKVTSTRSSMSRIAEVRMQLDSDHAEEMTLQFGNDSILHISEDGKAVWSF